MIGVSFKNAGCIAFCFFSTMLLSSCSIYKSEGRKKFDSESREVLSSQDYKPIQCEEISYLTYWYETHFSSPQSEWIESSPQLEVWKDQIDHTQIQLRTYENHSADEQQIPSITRCHTVFASLSDWQKEHAFYLKSLEGESP